MYGCFRLKKVVYVLAALITAAVLFFAVRQAAPMGVEVAAMAPEEGIFVPILMYHSVHEKVSSGNEYELSDKVLEADLKYLKEQGYTAVFVTDLIAYVYNDVPLPEKPVILTFDDGYYNNLTDVLPLLEQYDMKAVVSVVGSFSEKSIKENDPQPAYSYLTWENIRELLQSGRVEIGNHSYNMHSLQGRRGTLKKWGESPTDYARAFMEDVSKLQTTLQENSGYTPVTFAYPYGFISKESVPILEEMGFKAALSSYEKPNYITKDPSVLMHLNRYNRSTAMSTKNFMEWALSP